MKLCFNLTSSLLAGAVRLAPLLDIEISDAPDAIRVSAVCGRRIGVSLHDGEATVFYRDRVQFYRGLGILAERAKTSADFDRTDTANFDTVSTMIDASRGFAPTVNTVKRLLDRLALMGYNMMMLYTEDMVELPGKPFFGYMRGRYTTDELREIDDYAYEYGIEVIPCIECYGHMERYLIWPEASKIKDTPTVLLAREEATFEFLDLLISTVARTFRSKRIHIGMDEADNMGRGKFFDKHGYVPPFEIFNEFMGRLVSITDKYGLRPMMWSDMYFKVHSRTGNSYHDRDTVIPDSTKALIPENVGLVFWYYGEHIDPDCDNYMIEKHRELNRDLIVATGAWSWAGLFPENDFMMSTNKRTLDACKRHGVKEVMFTVWENDNSECDLFASLPGLSFFAENCYGEPTDEQLKTRFETTTGGDYDLFMKMSYFHNDYENDPEFSHRDKRFLGKVLLWQDVLCGLYDKTLWEKPMSEHYALASREFSGEHSGEWAYLYELAYATMRTLYEKTYIAERLVGAYKNGDTETLADIARVRLPALKDACRELRKKHRAAWFKNYKAFCWQNMDVRYGGIEARCETAIELIESYLAGEIPEIEELEAERLSISYHAYTGYMRSSTVLRQRNI